MPNPAKNPEADAAAFVQSVQKNDAKGATEKLQVDVQHGKTDPQYQLKYAGAAAKQLEDQHLLPQAAALLFGNEAAMKKMDINHDGKVDRGDFSSILARPELKKEFNTVEQQMIGVLNANADKMTKYGQFTAQGLQDYGAGAAERHSDAVAAARIAADPKATFTQWDANGDGSITKDELAKGKIESEKQLKHDLALLTKLKAPAKDIAEHTQEANDKIAEADALLKQNRTFSATSLKDWTSKATEADKIALPGVDLVAQKDVVKPTVPGFTADLMNKFVTENFSDLALSSAGGGNRISREDLKKYSELHPGMNPQDKAIVGQMLSRYDDIKADSSGISLGSLAEYRRSQALERKDSERAKDAESVLNKDKFDKISTKPGVVTEQDLNYEVKLKNELLGYPLQPEKKAEIAKELEMAKYLKQHFTDYSSSSGYGTTPSASLESIQAYLAKQSVAAKDYVDANGVKVSK